MLAERLLTGTPEFPRRGLLAAPPTSPRKVVASGFGVRTGVVPPKGAIRAAEAVEQQISPINPFSATDRR